MENLVWSNELTTKEAVRLIKLSFSGNALHLVDNIDAERHLNSMSENATKEYLDELEQLFISQDGKELTRVRFSTAMQGKDEKITLWATRVVTLYKMAYPENVANTDGNYNVTDRFISGLANANQKRFILEHKSNDDRLPTLLQLCLKYESVQLMMNPEGIGSIGIWKKEDKKQEIDKSSYINTIQQSYGGRESRYQ